MNKVMRPLLIALALVLAAGPALADRTDGRPDRSGWRPRDAEREEMRAMPLDMVIGGLMSQFPGKPLDARGPMRRGNTFIYEIVWLTPEGRQIVVIADAGTGRVLRVRGLD
jgi:hypothetical protein